MFTVYYRWGHCSECNLPCHDYHLGDGAYFIPMIVTVIETDCPRLTRKTNMANIPIITHLYVRGMCLPHYWVPPPSYYRWSCPLENTIEIPFLSKSSIACCTCTLLSKSIPQCCTIMSWPTLTHTIQLKHNHTHVCRQTKRYQVLLLCYCTKCWQAVQ